MRESQETEVRFLGWEDPLEAEMATHSSILAWEIPWTEEPGRLQLMRLQRVGHDLVTTHMHTQNIHNITFTIFTIFKYTVRWHKHIHTVVQLSPPSISRTDSSSQTETVPIKHEVPTPLPEPLAPTLLLCLYESDCSRDLI